VHFTQIVKLK